MVEKLYKEKISQWGKRKRMFKDLCDAITENSPKNLKEFKVVFISFKGLVTCEIVCFVLELLLIVILVNFTGRTWTLI